MQFVAIEKWKQKQARSVSSEISLVTQKRVDIYDKHFAFKVNISQFTLTLTFAPRCKLEMWMRIFYYSIFLLKGSFSLLLRQSQTNCQLSKMCFWTASIYETADEMRKIDGKKRAPEHKEYFHITFWPWKQQKYFLWKWSLASLSCCHQLNEFMHTLWIDI